MNFISTRITQYTAVIALTLAAGWAFAHEHGKEPKLYIVKPQDGAVLSSPVNVVFGLKRFGVAPAGMERANTGHHHLLINAEVPEDLTMPIPADFNHRHFGGGQTEAYIELEPGEYRLQLILGDHFHVPHNPPLISEPITITVE